MLRSSAFRLSALALIATLAFLGAGPAAHADSSEAAAAWLDKMIDLFEAGGFAADQTVQLRVVQAGAASEVDIAGALIYGGPGRLRSDVEIQIKAPQMGDDAMVMQVLTVSDGETLWSEMDNPALGGKMVTKQSASVLKGSGEGFDTTSSDPIAQIRGMVGMLEFQVVEESGGTVILEAPVTEEFIASLGPAAQAFGADTTWILRLQLHTANAFPRVLTFGDPSSPAMVATFAGYREVELTDESFEYTPPEGVQVRDMTAAGRPAAAPAP